MTYTQLLLCGWGSGSREWLLEYPIRSAPYPSEILVLPLSH